MKLGNPLVFNGVSTVWNYKTSLLRYVIQDVLACNAYRLVVLVAKDIISIDNKRGAINFFRGKYVDGWVIYVRHLQFFFVCDVTIKVLVGCERVGVSTFSGIHT